MSKVTNTLLVHHLEEEWRKGLKGFGETPEGVCLNIIDFLNSPAGSHINNVILTRAFEWEYDIIQAPLVNYLDERNIPHVVHNFSYADEAEMFEGQDYTLIKSTKNHSQENNVVCIQDWHKELEQHKSVMLCGAFDRECINDAEDMLEYVRKGDYERVETLIIGTGLTYTPNVDMDEMYDRANCLAAEFDEAIADLDDGQKRDKVIKRIRAKLDRELRDPGFLLYCRYGQDENGSFYAQDHEINEIIDKSIQSAMFSPPRRPRPELCEPCL